MIRKLANPSTLRWLVGVLILSNVIFAIAQILSHRQGRYLTDQLADTHERLSRARLDRSHLFHRVASIPLEGEFLSGTDVISREQVRIVQPPLAGVYYLLDSSCSVCPRNYDFLTSLVREGAFVAGVSPKDELETLADHTRRHEMSMLVLHEPAGALMNVIPQYGTPLLLVYQASTLVYLRGGVLTPEEEDEIRSLVSPVDGRR